MIRTGRSEPFREGEIGECRRMRASKHLALPRATKSSVDDEAEIPPYPQHKLQKHPGRVLLHFGEEASFRWSADSVKDEMM